LQGIPWGLSANVNLPLLERFLVETLACYKKRTFTEFPQDRVCRVWTKSPLVHARFRLLGIGSKCLFGFRNKCAEVRLL